MSLFVYRFGPSEETLYICIVLGGLKPRWCWPGIYHSLSLLAASHLYTVAELPHLIAHFFKSLASISLKRVGKFLKP